MNRLKKYVVGFALAALSALSLSVSASAYSAGIDDRAGLYTQSQIAELEKRQQEVADLTGWNIAVVTTNIGLGTDGSRAIDYAEDYYDSTFGSDSSSIVYLIDIDYRHISMDGDVLNYFNTSRLDTMLDSCERRYMDYDDVGNLEKFYYYIEYYYNKGTVAVDPNIDAKGSDFMPSSSSYGFRFSFAAAIIAGGVAAAIGIGIVLSRYKLHHTPTANCYLNSNSINMYRETDRFVREYTTRTRINDSSSGGGGHSRSHGGRSHGGGGRGGRR
ncbi:MAG: TPM domain-containing protein [Oscillospiraceae bacterium]|nr:TPM domain-containing protein [Oscillospiraceae bacterium]